MLRTCLLICALFLFAGCEKNWRGLMIEKRVYRDGYYVHLPWKRYTPKNEYPKPQPYPVDHSRNAPTDTTRQNVRSVPPDSSGAARTQTSAGYGYPGGNPTPGGTGAGSAPQAPVNSQSGYGGYGYPPPLQRSPDGQGYGVPQPANPNVGPPAPLPSLPAATTSAPPIAFIPPPQLHYVDVTDPVLPSRDSIPADTNVAVNDSLPIDSLVANEGFQLPEGEFSLIAELGVYNPVSAHFLAVNPQSYNAGFGVRYTIHPFSRHKISAEGSTFISNISIRQDQRKQYPLFTEEHDKERIMQWKLRFTLLDHMYITRNASAFVDAVEVGVFGDIGIFSTHVAIDQHGRDDKAALTRSKTRLYGLKYIRKSQFGITMRVANDNWSAFVNYRFSTMIKAGTNGRDLPKIVIGITRRFTA